MSRDLLHTLRRRVLVFDGAMGTSIQARSLTAEDFGGQEGFNDGLALYAPAVLKDIHASFLEAGCDVVETNTFGGTRPKLGEYGHGDRTEEINELSARLARTVADRFETASRPRFVAGSMGPTGRLPSTEDPDLGNIGLAELLEIYREQARGLVRGGCDVLILETCQDILEMKASILGARAAFEDTGRRLPLICQVTLDESGRMLLGTDIAAAMVTLEALEADVIGLNCSTGPLEMKDSIRFLGDRCSRPVSCIPNAGLPRNVGGQAVYDMDPGAFARALREFVVDLGVGAVGGCCGTTPEHIRRLAEEVGGRTAARTRPTRWHALSSGMTAVALRQEPAPTLVGERINTQGSRRAKRLVLADDLDGLAELGRTQVEAGAHFLDLCVALTERGGEADTMVDLVRRLSLTVSAPLCFDSTEPDVLRRALETCPGRPLVNSINLEGGEEKPRRVLPEIRRHGAAVVALVIDEEGMAKTADRKVEVARRLHDLAAGEFGLAPESLLVDALTFTLATGEEEWRRSALETLEGIRRIKAELPGVSTILGVSNVSFGLKPAARRVLNSVFLTHAVRAGLDAAIVNAAELTPYGELDEGDREAAEDMVLARREDALARFVDRFEGREDAGPGARDPEEGLSTEERIHHRILHRRPDGIEALLDAALETRSPVDVLNTVLLEAMRDVGDRFGRGELILPFVLQSAEVMKRAVAHVERFLDRTEGTSKGTVVLATVFGDVHDIGKNLVRTILQNNGYVVHDLGKQVPVRTILEKVDEVEADAVGLSALLVSTSKQMPIVVEELHRAGRDLPVLIGGAAINPAFGRRALFAGGEDEPYAGGVFYCRDAFQGLETLERVLDDERRAEAVAENLEAARRGLAATASRAEAPAPPPTTRAVDPAPDLPEAPWWGAREIEAVDLAEVFPLLDRKSLFTLSWGIRGRKIDREKLLREEFEPLLEELQREAVREGWLEPRVLRGYFPCRSEGNDIVVLDEDGAERGRFAFPRRPDAPHLCLADYVSPERDVLGLQVVTVGSRAGELSERWSEEGEYTRGYLLHGLAVETAEALAEWCHRRVRAELGLAGDRGKRYSPGYPACPDLAHHELMFELLGASAIDVDLTTAHQIVPEQSTAAYVLHHPEAVYYTMASRRGSRD
jgi:5-methyltetrahydrofolate--homocysteine methyltransferase